MTTDALRSRSRAMSAPCTSGRAPTSEMSRVGASSTSMRFPPNDSRCHVSTLRRHKLNRMPNARVSSAARARGLHERFWHQPVLAGVALEVLAVVGMRDRDHRLGPLGDRLALEV